MSKGWAGGVKAPPFAPCLVQPEGVQHQEQPLSWGVCAGVLCAASLLQGHGEIHG